MPIREGRCPRCALPLVGQVHRGVLPLKCPRCRGVFLRGQDLAPESPARLTTLLATGVEAPGVAPLTCPGAPEMEPRGRGRSEAGESCPAPRPPVTPPAAAAHPPAGGPCSVMRPRVLAGAGRAVVADVCPACRGAWFDEGEVRTVFRRGPTAIEAEQATDATGGWLIAFLRSLPIEGYNPVHRPPYVTWGLITACVLVFLFELTHGREVISAYGLIPRRLVAGHDGWRLVTSMFLHGGMFHLAGNMYFLKLFGENVEDRLGHALFLPFYLVAGMAASIGQFVVNPYADLPMVGASGAVGGLIGAHLILYPDARVTLGPWRVACLRPLQLRAIHCLPIWLGWQFVSLWLGAQGIAFGAPSGGLVIGFVLALALVRLVADRRVLPRPRRARRRALAP